MTTASVQILTWKCRLLPTRQQRRALEAVTEQQRQLYNAALAERIDAYAKAEQRVGRKDAGKHVPSFFDQQRSLTVIRADDPAYRDVQRRIQAATLDDLERAYKAFFKRAKAGAGASSGFPRFKGRDGRSGFRFNAPLQIKWDGKRLRFAGVCGGIRVSKRDRDRLPIMIADPKGRGTWKGVAFKNDNGRWSVCFQIETPISPRRGDAGSKAVGVDWGTSVLAQLSDGHVLPNIRAGEGLKGLEDRWRRAVARTSKRSKRRQKVRRRLSAITRRIANRRKNHAHKQTALLVWQRGFIALEDLSVKSMTKAGARVDASGQTVPVGVQRRRNREALDAAPYMLRQMIVYKCRRERAEVAIVSAKHTTSECSACQAHNDVTISDVRYACVSCGLDLPRKLNAARVILNRAGRGPEGGTAATPAPNVDAGPHGPVNTSAGNGADGSRAGQAGSLSTQHGRTRMSARRQRIEAPRQAVS